MIFGVFLDMFPSVPYGLHMSPKKLPNTEERERERVGQTLKTIRSIRGWKLGDFAGALNISYAYLSNIEAGRKPLTDQLLCRAAELLDVPQIAIKAPPVLEDAS